jgi:hypothetical protein
MTLSFADRQQCCLSHPSLRPHFISHDLRHDPALGQNDHTFDSICDQVGCAIFEYTSRQRRRIVDPPPLGDREFTPALDDGAYATIRIALGYAGFLLA